MGGTNLGRHLLQGLVDRLVAKIWCPPTDHAATHLVEMELMTGNTSLTGRWHGRYTYLDGGEGESFVAELVETLDAIAGSTTESANFFDGYVGVRLGSISGSRNGATVSFVKHYKFGHGHDFPIKYQGEVNDDATEIEGTWLIDRQGFGRFLLIRSIALPEPAAQLTYEKA